MYSHNLATINGQASAYVFLSLFNPVGSGVRAVLHQIQAAPYAASTSTSLVSPQVLRITAASGGTLVYDPTSPTDDVNKLRTSDPNSGMQIRTGDPTITASSVVSRVAPPIQALTTTAYAPVVQELRFQADWGQFTLVEGEGIAFRQTAAGDTDQRWPFLMVWSEVAT